MAKKTKLDANSNKKPMINTGVVVDDDNSVNNDANRLMVGQELPLTL